MPIYVFSRRPPANNSLTNTLSLAESKSGIFIENTHPLVLVSLNSSIYIPPALPLHIGVTSSFLYISISGLKVELPCILPEITKSQDPVLSDGICKKGVLFSTLLK